MSRREVVLRSHGAALRVVLTGPVPALESWWVETAVNVPALVRCDAADSGAWTLELIHDPHAFVFEYDPAGRRIRYRGQPAFQEVGMLLASVFERIHAGRGCYSMHAAGLVTPGGRGVLLFGPSFSGKTGALIALCRAMPGARFVGNERVLLDPAGRMVAGTRTVRVKRGDLPPPADPEREVYSASELLAAEATEPVTPNLLVHLKLHRGSGGNLVRTFTEKRSLTTLYGEVGELLHNRTLLLDRLSRPAPSFADPEVRAGRLVVARALVRGARVTHFEGDADELIAWVAAGEPS